MLRPLIALLLLAIATPALAGDAVEARIRKANPNLPIQAVNKTPMAGIFEIVSESGGQKNIYYVDGNGKYLIAGGHMFDTANRNDLTAARMEDLNRVDWSRLPLKKAIVSGDPQGLEVAIFTDPDCPFCRKLEQELKSARGIKVYTFLYPLTQLHPMARQKADAIWCAKDRHQMLMSVMIDDANPAPAGCTTPVGEIVSLAESLGIQGTPTLIARDGRRTSGAMSADKLKAWLARR